MVSVDVCILVVGAPLRKLIVDARGTRIATADKSVGLVCIMALSTIRRAAGLRGCFVNAGRLPSTARHGVWCVHVSLKSGQRQVPTSLRLLRICCDTYHSIRNRRDICTLLYGPRYSAQKMLQTQSQNFLKAVAGPR